MRLTLYICLTGLALGIERVEGKVEVMLGRLAGIDGAARELADASIHGIEILFLLRAGVVPLGRTRAKKRGPLQAVPVIARAMAERLG